MSRYHRWRFGVMLLAAVLVAVVQPLVSGGDDRRSFDVFLSVLIVAVSLSLLEEKGHRRKAVALAAVAIAATWLSTQFSGPADRGLLDPGLSLGRCLLRLRAVRNPRQHPGQIRLGRRDLRRRLRLPALGHHLGTGLLVARDGPAGLVPDRRDASRGRRATRRRATAS